MRRSFQGGGGEAGRKRRSRLKIRGEVRRPPGGGGGGLVIWAMRGGGLATNGSSRGQWEEGEHRRVGREAGGYTGRMVSIQDDKKDAPRRKRRRKGR